MEASICLQMHLYRLDEQVVLGFIDGKDKKQAGGRGTSVLTDVGGFRLDDGGVLCPHVYVRGLRCLRIWTSIKRC